jgi:Putative Flp pilus-assembly TadE/G-like
VTPRSGRIPGLGRDDGQTIPLYLVAGVALLFVALAFFAVGQAEDSRSSTQTAADAAALAAAKSARDEVRGDFLDALLHGNLGALARLLIPQAADAADCGAAQDYASRNGADVVSCDPVAGPPGYAVEVRSVKGMGKSVISGTEGKHAVARATAVIEPRCRLAAEQPDGGASDGGSSAGDSGGASAGDSGGGSGNGGSSGGSSSGAASNGGSSSGDSSNAGSSDGGSSNGGSPDGGGSDGGGSGDGGSGHGKGHPKGPIAFTCDGGGDEVVDPNAPGFTLDLGDFFTVRLTG